MDWADIVAANQISKTRGQNLRKVSQAYVRTRNWNGVWRITPMRAGGKWDPRFDGRRLGGTRRTPVLNYAPRPSQKVHRIGQLSKPKPKQTSEQAAFGSKAKLRIEETGQTGLRKSAPAIAKQKKARGFSSGKKGKGKG